jgi:hypothetical protein
MRAKRLIWIAALENMDTVEQEVTSGALAGRVRARIARRPGRWRERMHAVGRVDDAPRYPEAA